MTNLEKILIKHKHQTFSKISYSQFTTYKDCALKFEKKYVQGDYRSDYNINLTFGTSMHEVTQKFVQQLYTSPKIAQKLDLEQFLYERMCQNYTETVAKNSGKDFSNEIEMKEFYQDGCNILNELKQDCDKYFPKTFKHIGSEIHLVSSILEGFDLNFQAFIDDTFYDTVNDTIILYDYKTSSRGWSDSDRSNEYKLAQLRLYKYFISKIFDIDLQDIEIKFVILKRKVYAGSGKYPSKHITGFIPASGKKKIDESFDLIKNFVELNFDKSGSYLKTFHREANPSKFNCNYCPFKTNCSKSFFKN
jgi:PD-(D/E)XK nuclease superfamily